MGQPAATSSSPEYEEMGPTLMESPPEQLDLEAEPVAEHFPVMAGVAWSSRRRDARKAGLLSPHPHILSWASKAYKKKMRALGGTGEMKK